MAKSQTQKHMGRGQLVQRLTAQIAQRNPKDAAAIARGVLQKRGQMDGEGNLTAQGKKRDAMTAEERAKDRAAKQTGLPPSRFTYNAQFNTTKRH